MSNKKQEEIFLRKKKTMRKKAKVIQSFSFPLRIF